MEPRRPRAGKLRHYLTIAGVLYLALAAVGVLAVTGDWWDSALVERQPAQVSVRGVRVQSTAAPVSATPTATSTATATATRTATATATATPARTPTATATPSPTPEPTETATAVPTSTTAPAAAALAAPAPRASTGPSGSASGLGLVLANYFAWYSAGGWEACNISAGDRPLRRYDSDDPGAIATQVRQALDAGIDGFTLQWFAPGERTDANLVKLLEQSQGTSFRSTVIFLRHIWPGTPAPSQDEVVKAIRYLLERHAGHANWLRIEGRPVIFFTDMYRVPVAAGQTPQQAWASIRSRADPEHRAWWIAEGLDPSYLATFDGLYVYKIMHAAYPEAYLKASRWAAAVRQWEAQTGARKLWWGTISPGWDDTRSGCMADIRVASTSFRRERADGALYRATYDAALASGPDGLWVNSWNEWVEGTYVEPSVQYGDRYLQLTRELASAFKSR